MKKFLVFYKSNVKAVDKMANATPEQMQASMQRWMSWKESHGDFQESWGMPLSQAKTLAADGTTSAGDETLGGYGIFQADSIETALEKLKDHPHLTDHEGNTIEIHEMLSMPGIKN